MKNPIFTILSLCFFLINLAFRVEGQPTDCVQSSGENATISFGLGIVPTLNGGPLPNDSYISAMFVSSSGLKCAGFIKWEGNPTAISAQGLNGNFEGYAAGEQYKFRILLPNGDTIHNSNITVTYKPLDQICDNGATYKKDGLSCIQSFGAVQATSSGDTKLDKEHFIFPNPSSGIINFYTHKKLSEKVTIVNTSGSEFYFHVKDGIVDLSELNAGVYIIKYSKENFNFREKIILLD